MTRATAGLWSVLCLSSGGMMVAYSLTADIEGSLETVPVVAARHAIAVPVEKTERPLAIASPRSTHRMRRMRTAVAYRR